MGTAPPAVRPSVRVSLRCNLHNFPIRHVHPPWLTTLGLCKTFELPCNGVWKYDHLERKAEREFYPLCAAQFKQKVIGNRFDFWQLKSARIWLIASNLITLLRYWLIFYPTVYQELFGKGKYHENPVVFSYDAISPNTLSFQKVFNKYRISPNILSFLQVFNKYLQIFLPFDSFSFWTSTVMHLHDKAPPILCRLKLI